MKKNGFTFVELLVVITIIGVVFAAGVVSYTSISKNSRNARRSSDIEAIRQALEMCRSIDGAYPNLISNQVICSPSNTITMNVVPSDPKPCPAQPDGKYVYSQSPFGGYTLVANCFEPTSKSYTNP